MLPVRPECNVWMHPVLCLQSEDRTPGHQWRSVTSTVTMITGSSGQVADKSPKQGLLILKIPRLVADHRGLELLVVPHHHQLTEAESEGNQRLRLHTLTGLLHDTHRDWSLSLGSVDPLHTWDD